MRSPKEMRIIQIDITNACVHKCSNCTRFCGHHKKPFFMSYETFQKAVDSLIGFNRTIGIMGGEPTIHPQFDRFVKYAAEKHPSKINLPSAKKPIKNFINYIRDRNFFLDETLNDREGIGLWTSLCNNYYEHYELIQDVFSYQCINDHQNPSKHQPLLISRKELGISDDEWIPLRDKCWIQNMWSASITPKGAFFCEVAGALDMLFNGSGGWKIEPGWWKREPKDFGYQLQWCELCGGALLDYGRLSSEEIDDVSPYMYERLKQIESPKLKSNKVNILNMDNPKINANDMPNTINRYLLDFQSRISNANKSISVRTVNIIIFCDFKTDLNILKNKLISLSVSFDSLILAAMDDETYNNLGNIESKPLNSYIISSALGEWGRTLNKARENISNKDWTFIIDSDADIPEDVIKRIRNMVLNPGVLYKFNIPGMVDDVVLFNSIASAIKNAGYDGIGSCNSLRDFVGLWDNNKIIELDNEFDLINKPDLFEWYIFADNIQINDKGRLYKCLEKIKEDESIENNK